MAVASCRVLDSDVAVLRDLGRRVRAIAQDPVNRERREAWLALGELRATRPMILAETGGVRGELYDSVPLRCTEDWARELEANFNDVIFRFEQVKDDHVILPCINCGWNVSITDFGVVSKKEYGDNAGKLASYHWDPPIKDLDRDFGKLRHRQFSVGREQTRVWMAHLKQVFDGILDVRLRGTYWWTMGMTIQAIDLIGLEPFMLAMYDHPKELHRLMAFLRDDALALFDWLEKEDLLTLNNENDYIGSGSEGFTRRLPQSENGPVRAKDLWVLSESQETVGVSPELFEEFVFQYQLPVMERFGLCYYGCCEPVHTRWHVLKRIPNLQRVSVSPWCDETFMAEHLGRDYVFSRKPNPTLISCEKFDEDLIRRDLRNTLAVAKDCNLEIVMKDVHTLNNHPERLGRWVRLARECSGA